MPFVIEGEWFGNMLVPVLIVAIVVCENKFRFVVGNKFAGCQFYPVNFTGSAEIQVTVVYLHA
jgi:hypothetical protein